IGGAKNLYRPHKVEFLDWRDNKDDHKSLHNGWLKYAMSQARLPSLTHPFLRQWAGLWRKSYGRRAYRTWNVERPFDRDPPIEAVAGIFIRGNRDTGPGDRRQHRSVLGSARRVISRFTVQRTGPARMDSVRSTRQSN